MKCVLIFSTNFPSEIFLILSRIQRDVIINVHSSSCKVPVIPVGLNPLTPNDSYMSRTAPLTSKPCILYIYSTNVGTEYFKHALYSQFFSVQNAVCFIMLTCLVSVLFTFYIQGVLKLKKNHSGAKGLKLKLNFFDSFEEKYSDIKFHENRSSRSRVAPSGLTDGWSDRQT